MCPHLLSTLKNPTRVNANCSSSSRAFEAEHLVGGQNWPLEIGDAKYVIFANLSYTFALFNYPLILDTDRQGFFGTLLNFTCYQYHK